MIKKAKKKKNSKNIFIILLLLIGGFILAVKKGLINLSFTYTKPTTEPTTKPHVEQTKEKAIVQKLPISETFLTPTCNC